MPMHVCVRCPGKTPVQVPYPILRVLDSNKRVLQGSGADSPGFQGRHHQRTAFFAQKWQKNAIFWPKQCFWGLSGQL